MALYQCPTCGTRFTQMQCLKFLSKGAAGLYSIAALISHVLRIAARSAIRVSALLPWGGEPHHVAAQLQVGAGRQRRGAGGGRRHDRKVRRVFPRVTFVPSLLPPHALFIFFALACSNRIEYQFGRQEGEHDGIHELLEELKDKPLIRNLPSDNMKSGLTNTAVTEAVRLCWADSCIPPLSNALLACPTD